MQQIPLFEVDYRKIPCYNCAFMGDSGKDSGDRPIAWCHLKHLIVAPEIGCHDAKLVVKSLLPDS